MIMDMMYNTLWDGREMGIPCLYGIFDWNETNLKMQQLAKIIGGNYVFIFS